MISATILGIPTELPWSLADALVGTTFADSDPAPAGGGFFYLIEAQDDSCGGGGLGIAGEYARRATTPCAGSVFDVAPVSDQPVSGTVSGGLVDDGDDFAFEVSADDGSTWLPVALGSLPLADDDTGLPAALPVGPGGDLLVRVIDTDRTAGTGRWTRSPSTGCSSASFPDGPATAPRPSTPTARAATIRP